MLGCPEWVMGVTRPTNTVLIPYHSAVLPKGFKFKEYCPVVFRDLRARFNVPDAAFSVCYVWFGIVWHDVVCTGVIL